MKKLFSIMVFTVFVLTSMGLTAANAATYTAEFPSAGSTVVGSVGFIDADTIGWFWSVNRGDKVSENYAGTGLASVTGLSLDFYVSDNVLASGHSVDWDVLINGTKVGDWSWSDTDGLGWVDLDLSFGAIFGGGIYEIAMVVTNEVPSGAGSIALDTGGSMTLTGSPVPIPGAVWLLGSGLMGLIGLRRRFF